MAADVAIVVKTKDDASLARFSSSV